MLTDGAAYNPETDDWQPLASSPLAPGIHPQGVWNSEEILFYAGAVSGEDGSALAAYDPAADLWRSLPNPPLTPRRYATAAWTGQYFVLWGGSRLGAQVEFDDGAAYDPAMNSWLSLAEAPDGAERDRHAMVWVRDQLYITGGWETNGPLIFKPDLTR